MVKFGAVLFIVAVDPQFSIDLQLIGGVIILQTLPAVAIALYTRWLHRWALSRGWAVGMGYGLYLLYLIPNPAANRAHFGGSALALDKLTLLGWHPFAGSQVQIYVGFVALLLNLIVAVVLTPCCGPGGWPREPTRRLRPTTTPTRGRPICGRWPRRRRKGRRREQAGADRAAPLSRPVRSVHRPARRGSTRCHAASRRRHQKWGLCIDRGARGRTE